MLDEDVVLRNRQWYIASPWLSLFVYLTIFTAIVLTIIIYSLKIQITPENIYHTFLSSSVWSPTSRKRGESEKLVIMLLFYICVAVFGQKQRLLINRQGIRYISGLPGFMSKIDNSWSLDWRQIKNPQLYLAKNNTNANMAACLYFQDGEKLRKINPLLWVIPEKKSFLSSIQFRQFINIEKNEFLKKVNDTQLLKILFSKNIAVDVIDEMPGKARGFDLESNLRSKIIVCLLIVLLGYSFFEYAFIKQIYTYDRLVPLIEGAIIVFFITVISGWWMREGDVPMVESIGLAIFFAGALSCAIYFGLLRLNGVTNSHAQSGHYQMKTPGHFTSLNSSLPDFDYFVGSYYWGYIHKEDDCVFTLQKGILDFYQVNVATVDEITNSHYDEYKNHPKDMKLACDFSGK